LKVLVTGANGFLGSHVVNALQRAGHSVRALVRPGGANARPPPSDGVEFFLADLRSHPDLAAAFEDMDAVVHLAAAMTGTDYTILSDTLIGTERLLAAMSRSPVERLVLCSSFSVYDWLQAHGAVDEDLPVARDVYACGGYASAKLWQERLARRMGEKHGWKLTVLRPGFIWGPGGEFPLSSVGRSVGRIHLVFGGWRRPPYTHVENCADCFRLALENPDAVGGTFNVVDGHDVTAWRFMGEHLKRSRTRGLRVQLPYWLVRLVVAAVNSGSRLVLGPRAKLPSLFVPALFAQVYRPVRYRTQRLREALGWRPPLDFEQCLARTYAFPENGSSTEVRSS
jgi:UDP-glucose 4-epimerase